MLEQTGQLGTLYGQTFERALDEGGEALQNIEALGKRILLDTWRRVSQGEESRPSQWLEALGGVRRRTARIAEERAEHGAVVAATTLLTQLSIAQAAMPRSSPAAIQARRTELELAVLDVLSDLGAGVRLSRSEVRERLPRHLRRSAVRVGQVLAHLNSLGLVARDHERRQGSSRTQVYRVSRAGLETRRLHGRADAAEVAASGSTSDVPTMAAASRSGGFSRAARAHSTPAELQSVSSATARTDSE